MKPVKYYRLAWREYIERFQYYTRVHAKVGADFEKKIEEAEHRIQSTPRLFAIYRSTAARSCVVDVYPFTLYFVELIDRFLVYAVVHHKRRPGYWTRRLKKP